MLTASGRKPFRSLHPTWTLLNAPSAEPMSVTEAKQQTRRGLDETTEDYLFQRWIESARNKVEEDTRRAICWQRWKLSLDEWPDTIEIFRCPVIAVESVVYWDFTTPTANLITVDPSVYKVAYSEPCRIYPAFTKFWLPPRPELVSVEITFTAGYVVPIASIDTRADTLTFIDYVPTNGTKFVLSNSGGQLPSPLAEKRPYYVAGASGNTCQLSTSLNGSAIDMATPGTGLQFLGAVPQSLMNAMRKHVAMNWADREGSDIAAKCEESYLQDIRPVRYAGSL